MVKENLEIVSTKQVVLQTKIDKAADGISTIVSQLANASSDELDIEAKEAVGKLVTAVSTSSTLSSPNQLSTTSNLKLSSDQIKLICQQVTELVNDLASFRSELLSLSEQVADHIKKIQEDMKDMKKSFNEELDIIKADYQKEINLMKQKNNDYNQYLRKNNLVCENFLLPNWAMKNDCNGFQLACYVAFWLNKFLPMLITPVTPYNINITHPLRNNSKGQPVIIIRFVNRYVRHDVYNNREALLQHGITVNEHLTQENLRLKRKAEGIVGVSKVWSFDCKIYALSRGKSISIWNEKSLTFLRPLSNPSYAAVLERHNPVSSSY